MMDIKLEEAAQLTTDALTGFFTRDSALRFFAELESNVGLTSLSVLAVEISRFGNVNSSLGSELGDKIINTTAKRLKKIFPHAKGIARMHGDQFCLMFAGNTDIEEEVVRILDFAQRPLALRGEVIVLSVRVGVADIRCGAESASQLIHSAEVALHRSKSDRAKVSYFDAAMIEDARAQHQIENDLRVSLLTNASELHRAITNREFHLIYQPIIDTSDNSVHAFEALLRWHHPTRGLISPAVFIPIAEQISVMDVLGDWVMRKACTDAVTWSANANGTYPSVSINVSPTQFIEGNRLVKTVAKAIEESGITPERLKIEITETSNIERSLKNHLDQIKAMGCKISLDDFGTGYSSLARLTELPIDYVKVDQSFSKDLCSQDLKRAVKAERLVRAILAVGDSLDITSIVEGVETKAQLELIQAMGSKLIQGWVFSKPMPVEQINDYIEAISQESVI